jgi:hypothetical protein
MTLPPSASGAVQQDVVAARRAAVELKRRLEQRRRPLVPYRCTISLLL